MTFTGMLFQPVPWSMQTKKGMPADFEKYAADAEYVIINTPPNFMFQVRTVVCQSANASSGILLRVQSLPQACCSCNVHVSKTYIVLNWLSRGCNAHSCRQRSSSLPGSAPSSGKSKGAGFVGAVCMATATRVIWRPMLLASSLFCLMNKTAR